MSHEIVQDYYGKVLSSKDDLKSSACCSAEGAPPPHVREALSLLHVEVSQKSYGCGSPIPEAVDGCTVLDLGCGTGPDCFVLSKLVGPHGKVIGVDMTDEQLEVARKYIDFHTRNFGYDQPNVEFHQGYIEDLKALGIEDSSVDIVISNCVINLSPNKERVFSEIFRVLKPGGELYFADVFADKRIDPTLADDPVLLGECLAGAMYIEDFRRLLQSLNCPDFRIISRSDVEPTDPEISAKIGQYRFSSNTLRAFKIPHLEDRCENYGQVAYYRGTIAEYPHTFVLDQYHTFHTNLPVLVCGNTACMLQESRLAKHFRIEGDRSTHFGLFPCDGESAVTQYPTQPLGRCC